ncbi:uncharacterized protein RAG0_14559 [Rhynchosporium agropyri]|uniref:2EXR domain-containing protein n=1 Tax=Rhynchosporium agropyri TaxID=914238 RepID=A0A1E1LHJ1_9HELO|nr:uncharacterized protein RAG0_14559 [Rhynchosporium agropyri]
MSGLSTKSSLPLPHITRPYCEQDYKESNVKEHNLYFKNLNELAKQARMANTSSKVWNSRGHFLTAAQDSQQLHESLSALDHSDRDDKLVWPDLPRDEKKNIGLKNAGKGKRTKKKVGKKTSGSSQSLSIDRTDISLNHEEAADNEVMKSPTATFTRFSDLPAELRVQIWQMAMMVPRNIAVRSHEMFRTTEREDLSIEALEAYDTPSRASGPFGHAFYRHNRQFNFFHLSTKMPQPSLLHVNAESRYEAQKRFRLFENPIIGPRLSMKDMIDHRQPIIDATLDCLWFPDLHTTYDFGALLWGLLHSNWTAKIKLTSLAIPWSTFTKLIQLLGSEVHDGACDCMACAFFRMTMEIGLKEMVLVINRECDVDSRLTDYDVRFKVPAKLPQDDKVYHALDVCGPNACAWTVEKALTKAIRRYQERKINNMKIGESPFPQAI